MTDYALRMLMYLAVEQRSASIEEIASAYGVSRNHLMKVSQQLATLGVINARRGRGGGLSLAAPPEEISVGKVVRELESLGSFVECFDRKTNTCRIAGACGLQGALNLALADFLKRLDGFSLADLIPQKRKLLARLDAKSSSG